MSPVSVRSGRLMRSLFRASLAAVVWVFYHPVALANDSARAMMAPSPVGQVLVLPWDSMPGMEHVGSLRADIAHENGFRVYRVEFRGRTHWAHRVLDGRARPVAFLPNEGRFVDVLPELKVVLNDPDDLEAVIDAAGALDGKAYPPGWALLRLPPEVNPAEVAEALQSHPSVTDAEVQLRRPRVRPMQAQNDDSAHKDSPAADLSAVVLGFNDEGLATGALDVTVLYENLGAAASSETTVTWEVGINPDFSEDEELSGEIVLPPISPGGELEWPITLYFSELSDTSEGISYYGKVEISDSPEEPARNRDNNSAVFGFTVGSQSGGSSTIRARCDQVSRRGALGHRNPDPFVDEQWNLDNQGQAAFANNGGVPGEDLNMGGVIADSTAPTGAGVRVAVVDTGLEICHPDLEQNVEPGKSWNFLAPDTPMGSRQHDPFYPSNEDHGTSVAGITAAASDNGIGGRGVAPDVLLRGYNFLPAVWSGLSRSYFDSLGMSRADPDSSAVDIFNMSFGRDWVENAPPETVDLFRRGVENLREGLGAIYVKAAGNAFRSCWGYFLRVNNDIGCRSASADASSNLPYLIVVGGLNADGVRASYASVGANLWISAPAGEFGRTWPAMITTDQMGRDRGYSGSGVGLGGDASLNPNGNYDSTFSGTSSAAPNASGAIALLLEARPDLTWRDVKHILARTARQVDPGIAPVERLLSGGYYELQQGWTGNAAGYRFHNWYGFGAIDVDAALNLAAVHKSDSLGEYWETLPYTRDSLALSIADSNLNGARDQLRVSDLDPAARVESAMVTVRVDHPFPHDLSIELISPAGTRSVLNPAFNDTLGWRSARGTRLLEWDLLSNAFYGEDPTGDWELVVVDAASRDEGQLTGWDLRLGLGSHAPGVHPAGSADDDHGNIRRAATSVGSSVMIGGILELGGDVDYFRIVVTSPTTVVLSTSGSTDTLGVLEGEDGGVLVTAGDGGPGTNFRIVHQLTPGTYYLRVQGQDPNTTGTYTVLVELDSAGPVQSRAYAVAPVTARDRSWVRIRCESSNACPVMLDCADQSGMPLDASLSNDVRAGGTAELDAADILRLSGNASWEGRLACEVRSPERVSAQVWTQSGANDVLVNNTAILDSEPNGLIHVARAYSLPAPSSPSGNVLNLRIRCESGQGCTDVSLQCFDDDGRQVGSTGRVHRASAGIANGEIPAWTVAHLQADHVAEIIGATTWTDLRMSCDVESSRPISIQILTRSGGSGGPLVNNTALSLGR